MKEKVEAVFSALGGLLAILPICFYFFGIYHAFSAHRIADGYIAVFIPPVGWYRAVEFWWHRDGDYGKGTLTEERSLATTDSPLPKRWNQTLNHLVARRSAINYLTSQAVDFNSLDDFKAQLEGKSRRELQEMYKDLAAFIGFQDYLQKVVKNAMKGREVSWERVTRSKEYQIIKERFQNDPAWSMSIDQYREGIDKFNQMGAFFDQMGGKEKEDLQQLEALAQKEWEDRKTDLWNCFPREIRTPGFKVK